MKFYPLNLDVEKKSCAVVGGGEVALRKIRGLLAAGANVKVISPEVCAEVEELFKRGEISWARENFSEEMLGDEIILIAATNDPEVNRRAAQAARAKKILVNVVEGAGGNFNVPSTIRRGELLLTISTGANSPAFSKFLRQMLEAELGENFGAGLEKISARREEIKKLLPNPRARKIFWQKILTQETWQLLKDGRLEQLEEKINHALESFGTESQDGTD
ncbi:MAG: bifunctional precorrin-2 dehydrogenase/sirohydrochlorin ferrochelatase [Selenomonadaceae bacterium]|nr:bifunctional precorrin-2 dehydrogenase/sirohydrochlorin ferrochelatase [Selenomonadaceae bacterium]MBQ9498445.1 bifunctional precorrin-2 dehydrogenase/sirohydrochlorin ferrochelatase [Selenomonadaceae bacterium]